MHVITHIGKLALPVSILLVFPGAMLFCLASRSKTSLGILWAFCAGDLSSGYGFEEAVCSPSFLFCVSFPVSSSTHTVHITSLHGCLAIFLPLLVCLSFFACLYLSLFCLSVCLSPTSPSPPPPLFLPTIDSRSTQGH